MRAVSAGVRLNKLVTGSAPVMPNAVDLVRSSSGMIVHKDLALASRELLASPRQRTSARNVSRCGDQRKMCPTRAFFVRPSDALRTGEN
jgi:hypothetical protein